MKIPCMHGCGGYAIVLSKKANPHKASCSNCTKKKTLAIKHQAHRRKQAEKYA